MMCWHQHWLHSDDVMAVGLAYQIQPIWVPRPPASCKQANPVIFKPSRQLSGKPIPSMDFQTQQAAKYQPEGHLHAQSYNFPCWTMYIYFFVMTHWSCVHTNCKISTASAAMTSSSSQTHWKIIGFMSDTSWSIFTSMTCTPNLRSACSTLRRTSSWASWSPPLASPWTWPRPTL